MSPCHRPTLSLSDQGRKSGDDEEDDDDNGEDHGEDEFPCDGDANLGGPKLVADSITSFKMPDYLELLRLCREARDCKIFQLHPPFPLVGLFFL